MCRLCVFVLVALYCDPSYFAQFCGEKQNDVVTPRPQVRLSTPIVPPTANN